MANPSQASNHVYSAFALLGVILIILQLPLHLRAERTGTFLFIVWVSLSMLNSSINSIIWSNNTINSAPGWCDLSSYVVLASKYGVQLAPLCIARRLYRITTMKAVKQSRDEIRRDMFVDLFIGVGIPMLLLPLYYVVQSNNFILIEQVGCYLAAERTLPTFLLVIMWPPIFALVSAVYSALTIFTTIRRKFHMKEIMKSNEDLRSGKYWRLTILAAAQIVIILPSIIFSLVNDASGGPIFPFDWGVIHADFTSVIRIPISIWTFNLQNAIAFQWDRWMVVVYAILFFAFFGLTGECSQYYRRIFHAALKPFGYCPSTPNPDVLVASDKPKVRNHALRNPWSSFDSLRFMSHTQPSNPIVSANQITSLPQILSFDEQDHSHINNSGSAQETDSPSISLKSPRHKDNNVLSAGLIAEPEPAFGASSV